MKYDSLLYKLNALEDDNYNSDSLHFHQYNTYFLKNSYA